MADERDPVLDGNRNIKALARSGQGEPLDQKAFLAGEYTTFLGEVACGRATAPTEIGLLGSAPFTYNSWCPTFCNLWCHTLGGGHTCPVYRGGKELHDSLDINPCAYTLGFDPGCEWG